MIKKNLCMSLYLLIILLLPAMKAINFINKQEWSATVNGHARTVTTMEGDASGFGDRFTFGTSPSDATPLTYTISNVWTFFNFYMGEQYYIPDWELGVYGSMTSIDCNSGECKHPKCEDFGNVTHGFMNSLGNFGSHLGSLIPVLGGACSWCWWPNQGSKPKAEGVSYIMKESLSIALTNYGGYDAEKKKQTNITASPGYTISSNVKEDYSNYAKMVDLIPQEGTSLSNERWTSTTGIISVSELGQLQTYIPRVDFSQGKSLLTNYSNHRQFMNCQFDQNDLKTGDVKLEEFAYKNDSATLGFTPFIVSNQIDQLKSFSNLDASKILTSDGNLQLWNGSTTTFVDPCNHLFLSISQKEKSFTITDIPGQKLGVTPCLIIQGEHQLDLAVYEFTPPSTFKPKSVGNAPFMLSNNYYNSYTLRITTDTSVWLDVVDVKLTAEFDFFSDTQFNIIYTSDAQTSCTVSLSDTLKSEGLSFTPDQLTYTQVYSNTDLPFYPKVSYNCEGSMGDFPNMPLNLTTAGKIVTTPVTVNADLTDSNSHIPKPPTSWFGKIGDFFRLANIWKWVKYLMVIGIVVGAVVGVVYLFILLKANPAAQALKVAAHAQQSV